MQCGRAPLSWARAIFEMREARGHVILGSALLPQVNAFYRVLVDEETLLSLVADFLGIVHGRKLRNAREAIQVLRE